MSKKKDENKEEKEQDLSELIKSFNNSTDKEKENFINLLSKTLCFNPKK